MPNKWAIMAGCAGSMVCTLAVAAALMTATGTDAAPSSAPAASAAREPAGLADAKASDCFACHAIEHKVVGPAYVDVAKRYASRQPAIIDTLAEQVVKGTVGHWGSVPMPAHPNLGIAKARTIVKWILTLKPAAAGETAAATPAKTYSYKLADGKTVALDFPMFITGSNTKVTKDVFTGYEQYNSTCNRCHGDDAVGGAYAAPDLRIAMQGGLTWQQFLTTAMAGRVNKGMPSWAGFYTQQEIRDIYEYVKGRSLDLVPQGTPPSAQN
ncbi:MAG: cytochrome C [Rhodanobacteraceae bacterium]|nr:MAG: cytochrome C [Rhodanobacteraceae bacterium]